MKNTSRILLQKLSQMGLALLLLLVVGSAARGCDAAWSTEFSRASEMSKAAGRPILIVFLGSDWDEKSMTMDREIFKHPFFGGYSKVHFILLKVDFPQLQLQLPDMQAANEKLAAQYKIHSFPTLLLVDQTGSEIGRSVYTGADFTEFTTTMDAMLQGASGAKTVQ